MTGRGSPPRIQVVIADDHPIVLQGIRALLETAPEITVVADANDGLEAARLAEKLQPDVLIADVLMPGLNGLDLTLQVRERSRRTRILILSMHANEAYAVQALNNGASGYFLKRGLTDELVAAVRAVAAGERYLSPPLTERTIAAYGERLGTVSDPYETLTLREREVFQLAVEGLSNAQIAARLFISSRTAEHHREHFMRKLGLRTYPELVRYALRRGNVAVEEE